MNNDERIEFLKWSKVTIDDLRSLLNDVEKHLESNDETQQAIGGNYVLVINECFNNFGDKLQKRFDDLEKKGIVKRMPK